ncbi:hypothetical protein BGX27_002244 [Mortierella sp. AM989]|nr:hypothetical protein BGX27_002244 [Mortierella sp. AM989]
MSLPRSISPASSLPMQHDRYKTNHEHIDIHSQLMDRDSQSASAWARLDLGESKENKSQEHGRKEGTENEGEDDNQDEQQSEQSSWQEFETDVDYDAESEAESEDESHAALVSRSELPVFSDTQGAASGPRPNILSSSTSLVHLLLMQHKRSKSNHRHTDIHSHQWQDHSPNEHHIQRDFSPATAQTWEEANTDEGDGNREEVEKEHGRSLREGDEREDGQSDVNSPNEYESAGQYDAESEAEPENAGSRSVAWGSPTLDPIQCTTNEFETYSLPSLKDDDDDVDSTESDFNLNKLRQESLERLSQAWLDIFERYGKDVSELPPDDEIDLATGELLVDNGVLRSRSKAIFGTLTKLGHELKQPLADEREKMRSMLSSREYEGSGYGSDSEISDEFSNDEFSNDGSDLSSSGEHDSKNSSEYDSDEHPKQISGNESEHQSSQASSTSFVGERDELGDIWKDRVRSGSEPDSKSEVSDDESHSHDSRFHDFRDPQLSVREGRWSSSEYESDSYGGPGNEEEPEISSEQAFLSRSSASFEAASHFYRTEWRRARMMPRTRALADALVFKQPLAAAVVPSSPSKGPSNSIVPSSPLLKSSTPTSSVSITLQSFSVKRKRPNGVDYDLSLMPELDEDYV